MAETGKSTWIRVAVVGLRLVKKLSGNGSRHCVGSMGSHLGGAPAAPDEGSAAAAEGGDAVVVGVLGVPGVLEVVAVVGRGLVADPADAGEATVPTTSAPTTTNRAIAGSGTFLDRLPPDLARSPFGAVEILIDRDSMCMLGHLPLVAVTN
jgi:hypothetical protein